VLPALAVHGEHEGLYKEAYAAAQVLFGNDPKNAPEPEKGLDAFQRIHEAWAWSGDAANNLGFFYREAAKYELSLAWYLKSVERDPESQDILNDTGLIYLFHFPDEREKGLPYFLKTVALVEEGDQKPERGYWDALENLCKHYWEVDRQPEKVLAYAKMRYQTRKGVPPYNMSQVSERYAKQARKALGR
jgi:tetratricopeptide (TPR) repeat protein